MKKSLAEKSDPVESSQDDAAIGRALRVSMLVAGVFALAGLGAYLFWLFNQEEEQSNVVEVKPPRSRENTVAALPTVEFTDVTEASGIDFVHYSGAAGEKLLPETMGGGVAWLDYDNDGDSDLFFVNCKDWAWSPSEGGEPRSCALYRNDGESKFTEVTADVGLDQPIYGMGVAIGDYDNDGWTDLYISAVGENRLMHNDEGRFQDVTSGSGVAGSSDAWGTSCGFFDYDNDGLLDLFVCNYVTWSRDADLSQSFSIDGEHRAYGPPRAFTGSFSYLFHNEGDGKFNDVSEEAGLHVRNRDTNVPLGKAMGVSPIDLNGDGLLDLIVANDTVRNFLLINQGGGEFSEQAELCGIAYDRGGNARGAMGIDAIPFRDDGTVAIGIGNFSNEPSALYMAAAPNETLFNDLAMATGLGPQTRLVLTFGLFFFDADLDGRVDLFGANGHLEEEIQKVQETQRYAQSSQLFWNAGSEGRNQMIPLGDEQLGDSFGTPVVGRGAAYADYDGDGDLDIVIAVNGGKPRLLRNDQALGHHWLRVKLVGTASNRSAIGAEVTLEANGRRSKRYVMPTRSYLSQCELPLTFGLGTTDSVDKLTVRWPNGKEQIVKVDTVDQMIEIREPAASE